MLKRSSTVLTPSPVPNVKVLTRKLYNRRPSLNKSIQPDDSGQPQGEAYPPDESLIFLDNLHLFEHHHDDCFFPGDDFEGFKSGIEK
jgi:hypothetical protein